MSANQWHFVGVAFQSSKYNAIYIDTYINTKKNSYEVSSSRNYSLNTDLLLVGHKNNSCPDPFYIKNFAIDLGGAVKGYDDGGYSASILPFCLLRMYKSAATAISPTADNYYCIQCE
jgi:hypothetical protein